MATPLDLSYSEDQAAIQLATDRFCVQHTAGDHARQSGQPFPRALWEQLAQLGVFYPGAPGMPDSGGAQEISAVCETLGHHVFPGPIAATYLAIQSLEGDELERVLEGRTLISLSNKGSTLLPWGCEADLFLTLDHNQLCSGIPVGAIEPVATLGGDTWGRGTLRIDRTLPGAQHGLIIGNIATAAYLCGCAWGLLMATSEYAGMRKQFGKTLGEFQAVTHPLADCAIALSAAQTLARAAASAVDAGTVNTFDSVDDSHAQQSAAGALLSARRASLKTAFACHQVFAGVGITLAGPAFHISRRIRQVASEPPTGEREQKILLAQAGLGA